MSLSAQRAAIQAVVEGVLDTAAYTVAKTLSIWPVNEDRLVVLDTQLPLLAVFLADGNWQHKSGRGADNGTAEMVARFGIGLIVALSSGAQGSFAANYDTVADEVTDLMEDVMKALDGRTDLSLAAGVAFDFAPDVVMLNNGQAAYAFLITGYASKEIVAIAAD